MKISKLIIIFSVLIILTMSTGAISANDMLNNTITTSDDGNSYLLDEIDSTALSSNEDNITSNSTITVVADKNQPNQVIFPTVQPAIDDANPGDTIILNGKFIHCHFTINKPLTIIGEEGTTLSPCPHITHEGVKDFGVFYINEGGSGTVIKGFTFLNEDESHTPFSFLIRGASNVTIENCTMNYVNPNNDKYTGLIIENSNNVKLSNILINNTLNGIIIRNSSNIEILNNTISNNANNGINIAGNSGNILVKNNEIISNAKTGVNLSSANNISFLNNLIKNNGLKNSDSGSGIYVNTNITKLTVKGNIFMYNGLYAIMYDYRTRNLNLDDSAVNLTDIDNNYIEGHQSNYVENKVYTPSTDKDSDITVDSKTQIVSSKLTTFPLSDKYFSAKLVDSNGKAISGQKITFKLNGKTFTSKTLSNGIAKIKVSLSCKKTYTVTLIYSGNNKYNSSKATAKILVKTGSKKSKITASNMKVKKNSKKSYQIKLTDSAGKSLKKQKIVVKINGKTSTVKTNSKGIAKLSIKLNKIKKYTISMKFLGNANYKAVSKTSTVTVTK